MSKERIKRLEKEECLGMKNKNRTKWRSQTALRHNYRTNKFRQLYDSIVTIIIIIGRHESKLNKHRQLGLSIKITQKQ